MKRMVIYSEQRGNFLKGVEYRNPRYFSEALGKPNAVVVVGNWPRIEEAYRAAGVDVTVVPVGADVPAPPPGLLEEDGEGEFIDLSRCTEATLRAYCDEDGIEHKPSWSKKRLIEALQAKEKESSGGD